MPATTLLHRIGRQTVSHKGHMTSSRHFSASTSPAAAQYHIPKRVVHIAVPLLVATYGILRLTDPSSAPEPPRKLMEKVQGKCTKTHASDLNKYIKAYPDEMSDEHTIGWNTMYGSFKEHRKMESEQARIEEEDARQQARHARSDKNKDRSTKVEGTMATKGSNTNISHRPEMIDEADATRGQTFMERVAGRVAEGKRKLTLATKGSDLF
ncbi:hypothetical protein LTR70_008613 [Exophiala xenobiotica]|uniref:Uncharacterized protein n=1 Tax=Lithohypha guttulata TaxID=1690604 RepID=A0ABR0K338_9EURO|nr:hypothetical protein LTR24_008012 [Lithohypha guttulata]KAK5311691.1 hypothetical protein LTR70_008613 [Exophiala xenobiotica]